MTIQVIPTNGEAQVNKSIILPSFQEMREGLHVSYSQITQYMICPLKFQFQYVQGLQPEFISSPLPFGASVHYAIAALYQQLQATQQAPTKSDIQSVFSDRWDWNKKNEQVEVKFKAREDWNSLKDMGVKMIGAYYDYADSMSMLVGERVVCVEQNLRGDLGEIAFIGVIDLILRDPSDSRVFHLIDLKTAARRYDEMKVMTDMQLTGYKWLIEQSGYLGDDYELSLRWDVILKLKKEPVVERYTTVRGEEDIQRFLRTTKVILRAIEAEIFFPVPGWSCSGCGYKWACETWK